MPACASWKEIHKGMLALILSPSSVHPLPTLPGIGLPSAVPPCTQCGSFMSTPVCSFPHATSHTLLAKFKQQHEDNKYFLGTPVLEPAFIIQHFAGRVKYQIKVGTATPTLH